MLHAHHSHEENSIHDLLTYNLSEVGEKFTQDMIALYQTVAADDARALLQDSIRLQREITIEKAGIMPEAIYGERLSA